MSSVPWSAMNETARFKLLHGPALKPPDGVKPNLLDPPHRSDIAIAVTIVCGILTTAAVLIRGYSQLVNKRLLTLENVLGFIAFGAYSGMISVFAHLVTLEAFWTHQWDFTVLKMSDVLYQLYLLPMFYISVTGFVKSAILLEWKRIFVPHGVRNSFSWTCDALMIVSILFSVGYLVFLQFLCEPHIKIWRRYMDGKCRNRQHMDLPSISFNTMLDIVILVLPLRSIWRLHLTASRKIGMYAVFSVGTLALVCALGSVYATATMDYAHDVLYTHGTLGVWLLTESTCAILVFCVPTFPKAFEDSWVLSAAGSLLYALQSIFLRGHDRRSVTHSVHWAGTVTSRAFRGSMSRLSSSTTDGERLDECNDAHSQVHLADIEPAVRRNERNGILRTTEITTEVITSYIPRKEIEGSGMSPKQHQHPWDGSRFRNST